MTTITTPFILQTPVLLVVHARAVGVVALVGVVVLVAVGSAVAAFVVALVVAVVVAAAAAAAADFRLNWMMPNILANIGTGHSLQLVVVVVVVAAAKEVAADSDIAAVATSLGRLEMRCLSALRCPTAAVAGMEKF